MATFLDVSGLEQFSNFFVFIFVWLVVWALIYYTKLFEGNRAIAIIIGFVISLFVLISPIATGAVRLVAPWIAVILVFVVFITIIMKSFGAVDVADFVPLKTIALIVIIIAILVGALSYVREQIPVPGDTNYTGIEDDYTKTSNVVFHPKILGMLFIFAIAIFTIALLVRSK